MSQKKDNVRRGERIEKKRVGCKECLTSLIYKFE